MLDAVEPGVTAVAAPVADADGRIVAALTLVGPSFRLTGSALDEACEAIVVGVGRLESLL